MEKLLSRETKDISMPTLENKKGLKSKVLNQHLKNIEKEGSNKLKVRILQDFSLGSCSVLLWYLNIVCIFGFKNSLHIVATIPFSPGSTAMVSLVYFSLECNSKTVLWHLLCVCSNTVVYTTYIFAHNII